MRLKIPEVQIGKIKIGGGQPIAIQSMTDTDTADAAATAAQCILLAAAGSELVRFTVNTDQAAKAVPEIKKILTANGYGDLPLIGDFHFNGHILLTDHPDCAIALDKYRINPGNVGKGEKHDINFEKIIKIAIANNKAVRIGVNWGSLDQDLLTEMMDENAKSKNPKSDKDLLIDAVVESALSSAKQAEKLGLAKNKIVLSVKMSVVQDLVKANQLLASKTTDYAIHLGLTEAGTGMQGLVSSSAALAILLNEGIGDTIRISLTPGPNDPRTNEVKACRTLLQSMDYRHFRPQITSCPGCGRTGSIFFKQLAEDVNKKIDQRMPEWSKKYPAAAQLKIAVMGCVVNGPGESQHANIAISLPGRMEKDVAPVYINGKYTKSLSGDSITEDFMQIIEDYIVKTSSYQA